MAGEGGRGRKGSRAQGSSLAPRAARGRKRCPLTPGAATAADDDDVHDLVEMNDEEEEEEEEGGEEDEEEEEARQEVAVLQALEAVRQVR